MNKNQVISKDSKHGNFQQLQEDQEEDLEGDLEEKTTNNDNYMNNSQLESHDFDGDTIDIGPVAEGVVVMSNRMGTKATDLSLIQTSKYNQFGDEGAANLSYTSFLKQCLPNITLGTIQYMDEVMNTLFVASIGDQALVASVGLGNMTFNMMGLSIAYGLSSTLDTLLSQASGTKNYKLCGEYLHQGRAVMFIGFVAVSILLCNVAPIFHALNQDPQVAVLTQTYLRYLTPGFFSIIYFDIQRKLLISFQKAHIATAIQLIGSFLHVILNYIFIKWLNYQVIGLAISTSISAALNLMIISLYTYRHPDFTKTFFMPKMYMFSQKDMIFYFKLALPSVMLLCLPWWGFEVQFYIASQVSLTHAAAQVIMTNLCSLCYQIPLGISATTCVLVGNSLGLNQGELAKKYYMIGLKLAAIGSIIVASNVLLFRSQIPWLFTSDIQLIEILQETLPIYAIYNFFDYLQGTQIGTIKGMGLQKYGTFTNVIATWLVAIPLSTYLAIHYYHHIRGIWIALIVNTILQSSIYFIILQRYDWDQLAEQVSLRVSLQNQEQIAKDQANGNGEFLSSDLNGEQCKSEGRNSCVVDSNRQFIKFEIHQTEILDGPGKTDLHSDTVDIQEENYQENYDKQ
eukprot:403352182